MISPKVRFSMLDEVSIPSYVTMNRHRPRVYPRAANDPRLPKLRRALAGWLLRPQWGSPWDGKGRTG